MLLEFRDHKVWRGLDIRGHKDGKVLLELTDPKVLKDGKALVLLASKGLKAGKDLKGQALKATRDGKEYLVRMERKGIKVGRALALLVFKDLKAGRD
jgi:hypothetical protein